MPASKRARVNFAHSQKLVSLNYFILRIASARKQQSDLAVVQVKKD